MENMKKLNKIIFHNENIDFHKTRVAGVVYTTCSASKEIAYIITLYSITSLVGPLMTPGKVYGIIKFGSKKSWHIF